MSCIELSGHCSPKIIYSNNYAVNGSITITGIDYSGISFVNTPYINVRMTGFFYGINVVEVSGHWPNISIPTIMPST